MKVLTVDESADWLRARGLVLKPRGGTGTDHHLAVPATFERLWFGTPSDPAGQVSLAHMLASWFAGTSALLLVNVVALYEPHELAAFLYLRRYYGEERWVDGVPGGATPGHLFTDGGQENQRNVRELLITMMAYTFEGYFVQEDGEVILWIADEVIDVAARHAVTLIEPRGIVEVLRLSVQGDSAQGRS